MEPFLILAVAAVFVVIFAVLWQQRSQRDTTGTAQQLPDPSRQPPRRPASENEPLR